VTRDDTWVVVADGARARVFQLRKSRKAILEPAWEHQPVGSNLPSREIASDRPGRTYDRAGEGRHAKEPPTDPARHEKERFAREIVQRLDDARKQQAFRSLIVVAPPQFLGDLRAAMSTQLEASVTAELNKDLSKLKPAEIIEHLKDVI
jgi:protein required for attachment to host cells